MKNVDRRVLVLAIARAADSLGNSFLIVILPIYLGSSRIMTESLVGGSFLGVPLTLQLYIGVVLSVYGLLSSVGQPVMGAFSDRLQKRRVFVLVGLLIFGGAGIGFPFMSSLVPVLFLRAIQGLGAAMAIPATIALVNEFSRETGRRGENFGVFNQLRLIGFGFGPLLAGTIVAAGPYRTPVLTIAGIDAAFATSVLGAIVSVFLVLFLVDEPESQRDFQSGPDTKNTLKEVPGSSGLRVALTLAVGTFFMASAIAIFATLENPINKRLNQGTFLFSVQFAAAILANVMGQRYVGRASDRYGRRPFILIGFVILAPAVFAQAFITSSVQMAIARLILGVGVASVFAPSLALIGDIAAEQSGRLLSFVTSGFGLGVAFGPFISGVLFSIGSYQTPFLVAGGLSLVGLALSYMFVVEPEPVTEPRA